MISLNTEPYIQNEINLHDVSAYSKEMGINIPTFISHHLWHEYINPNNHTDPIHLTRRLWDVLEMLLTHIKRNLNPGANYPIEFTYVCCFHSDEAQLIAIPLKAVLSKDANRKHSLIVRLVSE
ncbi:hypothetical protein [Brevibacillus sp. SYSU BS000544]|uniref:hypothetical protein n=1 Tax=Brevibacillus sp. SYSU BS000544 TaxID=3416443 RepID=UPI003CE4C1EB